MHMLPAFAPPPALLIICTVICKLSYMLRLMPYVEVWFSGIYQEEKGLILWNNPFTSDI